MEWTKENVARKDFGGTASYVAGRGKEFLARHLNGGERRLADFGVFYGRNLPPLCELATGGTVFGVDTEEAAPAVARARASFPTVQFRQSALADKIPFEDGELNGGLCWRVLHNLHRPGELTAALGELHRVLSPGAPLLVSVRAIEGLSDAPKPLEASDGAGGTRIDLYFTEIACRRIFGDAGFTVLHVEKVVEIGTSDGNPYSNDYWALHLIR